MGGAATPAARGSGPTRAHHPRRTTGGIRDPPLGVGRNGVSLLRLPAQPLGTIACTRGNPRSRACRLPGSHFLKRGRSRLIGQPKPSAPYRFGSPKASKGCAPRFSPMPRLTWRLIGTKTRPSCAASWNPCAARSRFRSPFGGGAGGRLGDRAGGPSARALDCQTWAAGWAEKTGGCRRSH